MSFRENLREAISCSGLQQKELARKANISKSNIENYLREDGSLPTVDNAVKIAQALGVTVEFLVTGEDSSFSDKIDKLAHSILNLGKRDQMIIFSLVKAMGGNKKPVLKI